MNKNISLFARDTFLQLVTREIIESFSFYNFHEYFDFSSVHLNESLGI